MRCRLTRLIVLLVIPLFICLILLYVSAPPRFLVPMANRTQNINTQLVVECGAYARPTPEYQWIFNDTIITANHRLNLSSLSLGDQGFYTCVANNSFGSVSGKFYLAIQGKSFSERLFLFLLISKENFHNTLLCINFLSYSSSLLVMVFILRNQCVVIVVFLFIVTVY